MYSPLQQLLPLDFHQLIFPIRTIMIMHCISGASMDFISFRVSRPLGDSGLFLNTAFLDLFPDFLCRIAHLMPMPLIFMYSSYFMSFARDVCGSFHTILSLSHLLRPECLKSENGLFISATLLLAYLLFGCKKEFQHFILQRPGPVFFSLYFIRFDTIPRNSCFPMAACLALVPVPYSSY